MTTPQQIQQALEQVNNQTAFVDCLLRKTLNWPIPQEIQEPEEMSFLMTEEELKLDDLSKKVVNGQIYQFQPMVAGQPWGIFLVEFRNEDALTTGRGLTSPLRKILNRLVEKKRDPLYRAYKTWQADHLLFICTHQYQHFRFAYFQKPSQDRALPKLVTFGWSPDIPARTACEFNLPNLVWPHSPEDSPSWIQQWQHAFDKQKLTQTFFNEYKAVFDVFRKDLEKQTQDLSWAHDYCLQFLNRCMFLFFIQRKKWLGEDTSFFRTFWQAYQQHKRQNQRFVSDWLNVLFFEAFNNKFHGGYAYFPADIKKILQSAPYLNGGLFTLNKLDEKYDVTIPDERFEQILNFLDRYNFTVSEDTPLDIEVAVDAEMLGNVYESLVNISEDEDRRGDAGIFYTPRAEVDLMCRLSLVNYLCANLGQQHRELFYQWLFAFSSEQKNVAAQGIADRQLEKPLEECLQNLTVLDPACGSGAFLVGMLTVVDELTQRLDRQKNRKSTAYQRRKQIIGQSLYGVDVKEWACHVAELRLWLALIIDSQFSADELAIRKDPLLPNFTFNIRCGDSLIQEVGGLDMAHRKRISDLSPSIKKKLTEIKNEKIKFYNNDSSRKYKTEEDILHQELNIFQELLTERIQKADNHLINLKDRLDRLQKPDFGLLAEDDVLAQKDKQKQQNQINGIQQQMAEAESQKSYAQQIKQKLQGKSDIPFVWDISFAEIFGGDKGGFDIIIGNPPYVRQEKIADPRLLPAQVTAANKAAYKAKLQTLIYRTWPQWFKFDEKSEKAANKLDAKSDLYIYFFLYGLSLLNDKGTFCFVTSNSWLDVGYGSDLQEFLLHHCRIRLIIDNKVARSFKSADVNTAISIFDALAKPTPDILSHTARFVMFYAPFDQVLSDTVFTLIDTVQHRTQTDLYRVFPIKQQKLLDDGCEIEEEVKEGKNKGPLIKTTKKYLGSKWGGKYLRAPEIYWTILEKGKDKLNFLFDTIQCDYGIKPGSVDFFYLNKETISEWGIEKRFIKPLVNTTQNLKDYLIYPNEYLFYCHSSKKELSGTGAFDYIKWGERQGFHEVTSVKGHRPYWYSLHGEAVDYLILRFWDRRFWTPIAQEEIYCSDNFFYGKANLPDEKIILNGLLNCTFYLFQIEILGRTNQGQGVLTTYGPDLRHLLIPNPSLFDKNEIEWAFCKISKREVLSIFDEVQREDRQELDNIVFDQLKLTKGERQAVYEEMLGLVGARLKKAVSLKDRKKVNKRLAAVERTMGIWNNLPDEAQEQDND